MSWSDVPPSGYQPPDDSAENGGAPSWATGPRQPPPTTPPNPAAAAPPWAQSGGGWPVADPGPTGGDRQSSGWPGATTTTPSVAASRGDAVPATMGPPTTWLWIGALVPVVAAVLFVLAGPVENAVGWALAAFGSVAALAVFQTKDLARRASTWYSANDAVIGPLRVLVLVLALVVAAGHAYFFADWVARLDVFA